MEAEVQCRFRELNVSKIESQDLNGGESAALCESRVACRVVLRGGSGDPDP